MTEERFERACNLVAELSPESKEMTKDHIADAWRVAVICKHHVLLNRHSNMFDCLWTRLSTPVNEKRL